MAKKKLNEELLAAWLKMSATIRNNRVMKDMSYNEALVCNILSRAKAEGRGDTVTATDLCKETKLLKSQMNKILNSLEDMGLIKRVRDERDRRKAFICLSEDTSIYEEEHKRIMKFVDDVIRQVGAEDCRKLTELMCAVTDIVDKVVSE